MAKVCDYRLSYLFLMAALILLGPNLVADAIYARSSYLDPPNEGIDEKVQHLLSDQQIEDLEAIKLIFKEGDTTLPALVSALREGKSVERASWALATLGGRQQREILRRMIATQKDPDKKWLMAGFLAGALVEPSSDEEWNFLETCLKGYRDQSTGMASFYAALALGANASPKALHLLQTVVTSDQSQTPDNDALQEISQAIRWIEQRSSMGAQATPDQRGPDSELIKRIVLENASYAVGKDNHLSVEDITFTRENNRALVSVEVDRGRKVAQGYNIVLERTAGKWKIVGVWATWVT